MCNIREILDGLDRWELLEVKKEVEAKLRMMAPLRIIEVLKTCGSEDCSCQDNLDQRHGPYLVASFTQGGKQKQKNLGKKYLGAELNSLAQERRPDWIDFIISSKVVERVRGEVGKWEKGWGKRLLETEEFERFYGVDFKDDKFSRPLEVYFSHRRYDVAVVRWNDTQDVARNEFSQWGVGTLKGVSFLRGLLRQGYYLANDATIRE